MFLIDVPAFLRYIRSMETIFDHNVTPAELRDIFEEPELTREEIERLGTQDSALADIYVLYLERGDTAKAETFAARIQNESYRNDVVHYDLSFQ